MGVWRIASDVRQDAWNNMLFHAWNNMAHTRLYITSHTAYVTVLAPMGGLAVARLIPNSFVRELCWWWVVKFGCRPRDKLNETTWMRQVGWDKLNDTSPSRHLNDASSRYTFMILPIDNTSCWYSATIKCACSTVLLIVSIQVWMLTINTVQTSKFLKESFKIYLLCHGTKYKLVSGGASRTVGEIASDGEQDSRAYFGARIKALLTPSHVTPILPTSETLNKYDIWFIENNT